MPTGSFSLSWSSRAVPRSKYSDKIPGDAAPGSARRPTEQDGPPRRSPFPASGSRESLRGLRRRYARVSSPARSAGVRPHQGASARGILPRAGGCRRRGRRWRGCCARPRRDGDAAGTRRICRGIDSGRPQSACEVRSPWRRLVSPSWATGDEEVRLGCARIAAAS